MADFADALLLELAQLRVARQHFPMWTDWGVDDESVAVHSLGLSYLTTLGQALGYACCGDYPVADYRVRADSVWWDKKSRKPVAVFEFERHKGGDELRQKVRNLLRAYHALRRQPELLCLIFWTKNFYPITEDTLLELWRVFEQGYDDEDRARIPPGPVRQLRIFECLHRIDRGRQTLKGIIERAR